MAGEVCNTSSEMPDLQNLDLQVQESKKPLTNSHDLIAVKVKDLLDVEGLAKEFVYSSESHLVDLFRDVAKFFKRELGEFGLVYQSNGKTYQLAEYPGDFYLATVNLTPSKEKVYPLVISDISSKGRKVAAPPRPMGTPTGAGNGDAAADGMAGSQSGNFDLSRKREFVGLKNIGATCYLNSLVQGFWFTPEFRNLILKTSPDPQKVAESRSICYALQQIFLNLQFSNRDAVETDYLTSTFGWSERDVTMQQDIQELCTLLMDSVKTELKKTEYEQTLKDMFYGTLNDYVKCLSCGYLSAKPDKIFCVPLPVSKFDKSKLDKPKLEEALKLFVAPDLLDGGNQYNCSKCEKKVDAHKGCIFSKLPYILTLQLKRFDFDFQTGARMKVNDRVEFPIVLNMNQFVEKPVDGNATVNGNEASPDASPELSILQSPSGVSRTEHSRANVKLLEEEADVSADNTEENTENSGYGETVGGLNFYSSREAVLAEVKRMRAEHGPNVYELFAIFVHKGSIGQGHYYAFIRDVETYRWYRCDDTSVRKAHISDILTSYGVKMANGEATTAYIIMYRRTGDEHIMPFLKTELPTALQERLQPLLEEDQKAHVNDIISKTSIRVAVVFRNRMEFDFETQSMNIDKGLNTKQVAQFLFENRYPDRGPAQPDLVRICRFDLDLGVIENTFDDETQYLTYSLRHPPPQTDNEAIILQVFEAGEIQPLYQADDFVFLTHYVDTENDETIRFEELHARPSFIVGDLRMNAAYVFSAQSSNPDGAVMQLGLVKDNSLYSLDDDSIQLEQVRKQCGNATRVFKLLVRWVKPDEAQQWKEYVARAVNSLDFTLEIIQDEARGHVFPQLEKADHKFSLQYKTDNPDNAEVEDLDGSPVEDANASTAKEANLAMTKGRLIGGPAVEASEPIRCPIRIDGRASADAFCSAIADILKVNMEDFILLYVKDGEEVEVKAYALPIKHFIVEAPVLRLKFSRRLKANEGRVNVLSLDFMNPEMSGFPLGDIVLSPDMGSEDVKKLVSSCVAGNTVELAKLRLRRRAPDGKLSKILKDVWKVDDWLTRVNGSEVFAEFNVETPPLDRDDYGFVFRVWHPSDWTLEKPRQAFIYQDFSEDVHVIISKKLEELTGIPVEEMELAKVEALFPFQLNPYLCEEQNWFAATLGPSRPLYLYADEAVIFVRNKNDVLKKWSAEEEKQFKAEGERIEYDDDYVTPMSSPPKRETGVTLKLPRFSESDVGSP